MAVKYHFGHFGQPERGEVLKLKQEYFVLKEEEENMVGEEEEDSFYQVNDVSSSFLLFFFKFYFVVWCWPHRHRLTKHTGSRLSGNFDIRSVSYSVCGLWNDDEFCLQISKV